MFPPIGYVEILESLSNGKAAMGIEWMAAAQDLLSCEKSLCDANGEPLLGYTLTPGISQTDGSDQTPHWRKPVGLGNPGLLGESAGSL